MKSKSLLPWLCVAGLLVGFAALFLLNRKQQAELAQLRQENQELQKLRATVEKSKQTLAQNENQELIRLRKDNEDLLRLRNEVRQLRDEKQKLNKQVQTAQTEIQSAQARAQTAQVQAQAVRDSAAQAAIQGRTNVLTAPSGQPMSPAEAEAFRARYGLAPGAATTPDQEKMNICINNLRQIDGAKQQWALENKKTASTFVTPTDIAPYLRSNTMPVCPAGGVYTLNLVASPPVCSVPGHALPK